MVKEGIETEFELGVAKDGALGCNDEVTDRCQVESPAQGNPPDGCNDGLAESENLLQVTGDEVEVIIDLIV
jgi:hypothetical protein